MQFSSFSYISKNYLKLSKDSFFYQLLFTSFCV